MRHARAAGEMPAILRPVFSALGEQRYALGIETIYEGYLLHYGRPRLFGAVDRDKGLLLGDYLFAHGLVRVAAHSEPAAVASGFPDNVPAW